MPSDSPTMAATGTAEWEDSLRIATLEQSCCVMLCFVFLFDIYFGKSKTQRRTWTSNLSSDALFYSLSNSWDPLARSLRHCCSLLFLTTYVLEATSSLDPRTVNRTHAICSFFHEKRYLLFTRIPYELSGKESELNINISMMRKVVPKLEVPNCVFWPMYVTEYRGTPPWKVCNIARCLQFRYLNRHQSSRIQVELIAALCSLPSMNRLQSWTTSKHKAQTYRIIERMSLGGHVSVALVHQLLVLFPLPTWYSLVQGTKPWTFLVLNLVMWLNPNLSSCWIPPGFIARVIPIYRWSPPPLCWPSIRRCQPLQGLHHSTESREGSACKTSRIFFTKSHWLMYVIHDNDNNVCIYLASWGLSIFSLNHDHVSTSPIYIYILYTDLYIFFMDVNGAIWGLIIFVSGHDGKEKTWHDHDQTFFSHTFSLLNEFYISTVSWHLVYLNP